MSFRMKTAYTVYNSLPLLEKSEKEKTNITVYEKDTIIFDKTTGQWKIAKSGQEKN